MSVKILLCAMLVLSLVVSYSQAKIDPDRIVGIWLLDEGKGDVAEEASENGRKGTITQGSWEDGKVDGALEIKKGGTVTIPLGKGIIEDKVTFTLWINFTDIGGQQNYFSIWDQSNNRYVPYKNGGNLMRSWTNTWDVASGVTVKAGHGIMSPMSTTEKPVKSTLMAKRKFLKRCRSSNSKIRIRRHGSLRIKAYRLSYLPLLWTRSVSLTMDSPKMKFRVL